MASYFWIASSFAFSMHEAPETGFVVSIAPPELRATATAAATTLQGVSTSFGSLLGGYLWSTVSPQSQFIATATISITAIILFGTPLLRARMKR